LHVPNSLFLLMQGDAPVNFVDEDYDADEIRKGSQAPSITALLPRRQLHMSQVASPIQGTQPAGSNMLLYSLGGSTSLQW